MSNQSKIHLDEFINIKYLPLYEIPESWIWVPLKSIGEIVTGNTPSKKNDNYWDEKEIPWVGPADLDKDMYISGSNQMLSKKGAEVARVLKPKSILISCIGNLGKTAMNLLPMATNQQINSIVPSNNIVPEYIYYLVKPIIKPQLEKMDASTTLSIVNKGNFSECIIPIPPYQEQKRIVEKLMILLESIADTAESLNRAKNLLQKRYEAILRKAFYGELVKQDSNDDHTNRLPEIKEEDVPYELPNGWVWTHLGNVIDLVSGIHIKSNLYSEDPSEGMPYFTGPSDFLDEKTNATKFSKNGTAKCSKNDILITVKGSGVGSVAIASTSAYIGRQLMAISPKCMLLRQYLFYWLKYSYKDIQNLATGIAIPGITRNDILGLRFPLPPISEQEKISRILEDEINQQIEIIEAIKISEERLQKMHQSLLRKSFCGKLVEQRPEEGTGLDLLKKIFKEK